VLESQNQRVIIVTVYNSYNCGSALQARMLYETVEDLGYDAYFLNTHARSMKERIFKNVIKYAFKAKFDKIREQFTLYKAFESFLNYCKTIDADEIDEIKDCFILGSDEIWNVSRPEMLNFPVFWGEGLPKVRTISYAPSVNQASAVEFKNAPFVLNTLNELHDISVRDTYSKDVLCSMCSRDIKVVCDPTHLVKKETYNQWLLPQPSEDYILVYGEPSTFSKDSKRMIKEFAKEKNKKIISFFFDIEWSDKTVKGGPCEFLTYIKWTDYIAGMSFHITAFSIMFQKNFVCLCDINTKVRELLSEMGIADRMLGHPHVTIKQILETPIDYTCIQRHMENTRKRSIGYLNDNLREITSLNV
jgi:hypothetical protein